jgi:hypothetical protein
MILIKIGINKEEDFLLFLMLMIMRKIYNIFMMLKMKRFIGIMIMIVTDFIMLRRYFVILI